ncbi:MAG: hypothetical protein LBC03_06035 [Nitrososphaerota archaeon]|jgi:predicted HicB family RNase H-like nuclease|nr:hypothetical protein [Nitrososphaerota archaeon]
MSKNFKTNPALQFMGQQKVDNIQMKEVGDVKQTQEAFMSAEVGEKINRRVQLLLPPTLHKKASDSAKSQGKSFGEYVRSLIERDLTI